MTATHLVRHFDDLEDYRACVSLQEAVWGAGFSETVPTAILKVSQLLGGVAAGAFHSSGRLDAFVFGLTGLDAAGGPVHWSDMLAVRPDARGGGLGMRLKWFQREAVLERGVRRMLWTFDPLRARNAHLNLNRLGAVVAEYRRDMYGETDSVLHRGIGTDRFVASWQLDSERVRARVTDEPPDGSPDRAEAVAMDSMAALTALDSDDGPRPGTLRLDLELDRVHIAVPSDIDAVMDRDLGLAIAWREATREAFTHYLARGFRATELLPGGRVATYLLDRTGEAP